LILAWRGRRAPPLRGCGKELVSQCGVFRGSLKIVSQAGGELERT